MDFGDGLTCIRFVSTDRYVWRVSGEGGLTRCAAPDPWAPCFEFLGFRIARPQPYRVAKFCGSGAKDPPDVA